ncbi:hypothetical protein EPI10_002307 [Gossypium australe]|uniref:Uncharacterized protein n=1 Tax=Gossypium australe TaxID=47621 RepID=A0A5B6VDU7_9ROSI|nr:hypothetical protein EPI10_002307 [Gossypium australe]
MSSPPVSFFISVVSFSSSNDTVVQGNLGNGASKLERRNREKFPTMKLQDFVTHIVIKKIRLPSHLFQCYLQDNGTWFMETLPPEKKPLGSNFENWKLHQIDVYNALLHADLD